MWMSPTAFPIASVFPVRGNICVRSALSDWGQISNKMEAQVNPANSVLLWLKASSKRNKIHKWLHLWHRLHRINEIQGFGKRSCKWKTILISLCHPFLSLPKEVHNTASASKESTSIPKYIHLTCANMETPSEAVKKLLISITWSSYEADSDSVWVPYAIHRKIYCAGSLGSWDFRSASLV